jgi:hypothetical protein
VSDAGRFSRHAVSDGTWAGVTLAFAVPVGLLGLDMLSKGNTLVGGGFLAVAVLMVVLQEYLTTPGDVPGRVVGRLVGGVAKDPEAESEGEEPE